jgi:hypothetical protein
MLPESSHITNNDNHTATTTILPRLVAVIIGMFERVVVIQVVAQQRYSFYSWHVRGTWLPIFRIGSVPLGSILQVIVTVGMFPTGIRHVITTTTFVLDTPQL